MNEQIYAFACCVRPSTESILLCEIPFEINPESQDDQLRGCQYCFDKLGGEWIPMGYARELSEEGKLAFMKMMRETLFQGNEE